MTQSTNQAEALKLTEEQQAEGHYPRPNERRYHRLREIVGELHALEDEVGQLLDDCAEEGTIKRATDLGEAECAITEMLDTGTHRYYSEQGRQRAQQEQGEAKAEHSEGDTSANVEHVRTGQRVLWDESGEVWEILAMTRGHLIGREVDGGGDVEAYPWSLFSRDGRPAKPAPEAVADNYHRDRGERLAGILHALQDVERDSDSALSPAMKATADEIRRELVLYQPGQALTQYPTHAIEAMTPEQATVRVEHSGQRAFFAVRLCAHLSGSASSTSITVASGIVFCDWFDVVYVLVSPT